MTHPFTDQYIAMVRTAEEIQALRADDDDAYQLGDWFLGLYGPELLDRSTLGWELPPAWLPRLDQLLGMLGSIEWVARKMFHGDADGVVFVQYWCQKHERDWHELALAVVMREKYGKVWNGREWRTQ